MANKFQVRLRVTLANGAKVTRTYTVEGDTNAAREAAALTAAQAEFSGASIEFESNLNAYDNSTIT